jgi:hypothetical protein
MQGRSILSGRRLIAASNHLLDLTQQRAASRLTPSEEAIHILFGPLRRTVEVEPKVEPLTDPHHLVENPPPPVASEDEIYPERRKRHRENGTVFCPIDQQLELKDGEITD